MVLANTSSSLLRCFNGTEDAPGAYYVVCAEGGAVLLTQARQTAQSNETWTMTGAEQQSGEIQILALAEEAES